MGPLVPADTRYVPSEYSNRGAKRAREAREALGYTRESVLPDLLDAIERAGQVQVLILELPDGVAGAYIARSQTSLILVNGRQVIPRQRFTLAHEFGHHRMGHKTVVDQPTSIGGFDHDPDEVAANAFAAEFLMPKLAVRGWAVQNVDGSVTLEHVVRLAYHFGVSAQAARYSLATAQVLTDSARCHQLDEEIADDLHVQLAHHLRLEPLEDELSRAAGRLPRIPRALKNTALGDLLAGDLDLDGFADRLGCERAAAEAMLMSLGLTRVLPAAAF